MIATASARDCTLFDPQWASESQLRQARGIIMDTIESHNLTREWSLSPKALRQIQCDKREIEAEMKRRGMTL